MSAFHTCFMEGALADRSVRPRLLAAVLARTHTITITTERRKKLSVVKIVKIRSSNVLRRQLLGAIFSVSSCVCYAAQEFFFCAVTAS